jgi:hypothetical protein
MNMSRPKISVFPAEEFLRRQSLLQVVSQLYAVDIVAGQEADLNCYQAALIFGESCELAVRVATSGLRCLTYIDGPAVPVTSPSMGVRLSLTPHLPQCFRGRTLTDKAIDRICHLKAEAGDEILARKGDDLLWLRRKEGASVVDLVALAPPEVADDDSFFQHFQKDNWMRLLPILHLARELSGWQPPPVRACFMFDDPNLHWPRYGHVDFRKLALHSERHNYHASFATVPLDGWFVHEGTATIFRNNPSRLSLLCHGNNHTTNELAGNYSAAERQALLAQALRRIESLERRSGLEVSRVMAAPHGACSEIMMGDIVRLGFEAACISHGSLKGHNEGKEWVKSIGLEMAKFVAGLPVIPRLRISSNCQTEILLAAFLNQPIIPMGHHEDLAGGLNLLEELAAFINSIGNVQWMDMRSIARSDFYTSQAGQTLHINMYSRFIELTVPEGVTQLCIERPWLKGTEGEGLRCEENQVALPINNFYQGEPIRVRPGIELQISSMCANRIDPYKTPAFRIHPWVVMRRCLCEVRDRMKPLLNWRASENKS